jgi:hypothetical protein
MMRFRENDFVVSDEHPTQPGRVERVRIGAGLVRVRWTRNTVTWELAENLEFASVPVLTSDRRGPRPMHEVTR